MTRCEQRVAKFHHLFESELNWCTQKNEEEKSESQKNCRKDNAWRKKKNRHFGKLYSKPESDPIIKQQITQNGRKYLQFAYLIGD